MKKSNLKRKRYQSARLGSMLAAALLGTQITDYGRYRVLAEDQQWEGVTSLSTDSEWLAFDSLEAELVVEEVYTEEESSLTKGDAVLKLTQESYEDAVRYYTAALLRAQNELTDAELEHEKGMLEAEYTVELTRVQAELAESKREQFQKELEDTIEEHEEVAAELEEKLQNWKAGLQTVLMIHLIPRGPLPALLPEVHLREAEVEIKLSVRMKRRKNLKVRNRNQKQK